MSHVHIIGAFGHKSFINCLQFNEHLIIKHTTFANNCEEKPQLEVASKIS